ncbi:acyl carrier protein [Photorhabdus laumondii]
MKDRIFKIVNQFSMRDEFTYDEALSDLGIDSMAIIDMILEIEEKLNITIPDDRLTEDYFYSINKIFETISEIKSL